MKKLVLGIILFISCSILFFIGLGALAIWDEKNIIKSDDILLYQTNEYPYLPNYDEFEYKEYINGFYLYDSSKALSGQAVTYVLELKFNTLDEYNNFLEYEYNRFEYKMDSKIKRNNYECYICPSFEMYYYKGEMPYALGMLCLNKTDLVVRYLYYKDIQIAIDINYNSVFNKTNCEW